MKAKEFKDRYGIDVRGKWSLKNWPYKNVGFLHVYPLYFLIAVGFYKDPSWWWLLAIILLHFCYRALGLIGYYLYSFLQLRLFIRNFFGRIKKFELYYSLDLNVIIQADQEFNWAALKKKYVNRILRNKKDIIAQNKLVNVFYAKPVANRLLSSCKAYFLLWGQVFIVNRHPSPSRDAFESFLFFHELEHINDRGFMNLRSLVRARFIFFIHFIIFGLLVEKNYEVVFLAIFALTHWYQRFIATDAAREIIADNMALLQIKDKKDRLRVINLLIKSFKISLASKANWSQKQIWKSRLELAQFYQKLTIDAINEKIEDESLWYRVRPDYNVYNYWVMIGVAALFPYITQRHVDPKLFLRITGAVISCCLIAWFLFGGFVTRLNYLRVDRLMSKIPILATQYQPVQNV